MHDAASDEELAQQAARGVTAAFHRLTERYYRPVGGFLFKRVGRPDVVEDLVQETFLEAWQAIQTGRGPRKLSSWLFGIAHNRAGKWLRRKRPILFDPTAAPDDLGETPPEQTLLDEVEEQQMQLSRLEQELQRLPVETRQLLEWKHCDGKTCEEIAADTQRPVGTVKSLLARTYKTLRTALASTAGDANS
jgi:RNA polymerase sigma-70 factor (ECF subfamily)